MGVRSLLWESCIVFTAISGLCFGGDARPLAPPKATDRIVCLGNSITDGYTYGQIIMQALKEAGKPVPPVIGAGVASDTAPQMAARLDKTVLVFKPSIVTFSAGTNDSLRGIAPGQYEQSLREISKKVKEQGGTMILLTPCVINPGKGGDEQARNASAKKAAAAEKIGAQYGDVIRRVAAEEGYPVAENNALMRKAREAGKEVMSDDGIHPNYFGQSLMARSILDAMGYAGLPLPAEFKPALFPGVVREWKMRLAPADDKQKPQALDEKSVNELAPDGAWKTYVLPDAVPDAKPSAEDWLEQIRRNGFGMQVEKQIGKGLVQAVAVIDAPEARKAWINTGVNVSTVWLNGRKLHDQGPAWTGFHAGKERIAVDLKPGKNVLAIEIAGSQFFLSVTDKLVWEEDLR